MPEEKSQRVVITLPYTMYAEVKALADRNRRPMAEEVRMALEKHLEKTKDASKGQFLAVAAS